MSTEEEIDLKDMVSQALEANGCLPKIKAQLRANLFLALDEDPQINRQQPLLNAKIKSYLQTSDGQLMFCLVREFLEYFNLDFTASVYEPESYVNTCYKYEGRDKVINDLGLRSDEMAGPVLLQVVKIAQAKAKTLEINLNLNGEGKSSSSSQKINGQQNLNATFVKKDPENDDTFNGTSSIEEESVNDEDSAKTKSKSDKFKPKLEIPPLQLNKTNLLPSKDFKEKTKDFDFEITDDYEEDFMSGSELEMSQSKLSPKPLFESKASVNSSTDIDTNLSVDQCT